MKTALFILFLACSAKANSYSTSFGGANENPISEGGHWINGLATGLSWSDCGITNHVAFGSQTSENPLGNPFNDATAVLNAGYFGPNQWAQAAFWIDRTTGINTNYLEIELRLNTSISASSCTGYEIDYSANAAGSPRGSTYAYMQITRWNGPFNTFTTLVVTNGNNMVINAGDILSATNIAGTIKGYINGTNFITAVDTTYTGGSPGIGFDMTSGNGTLTAHSISWAYGFTNFYAGDGLSTLAPPLAFTGSLNVTGSLNAK